MVRISVFVAVAALALPCAAAIASKPAITPAEKSFVAGASATLQGRFPDTAAARSGGYSLLYDRIDADNTYNWTDFAFTGVTPAHPNFLWFDRRGHLAGADWELPKSRYPTAPQLAAFPVRPARWVSIGAHVHYAYRLSGKTRYGFTMSTSGLRAAPITARKLRAAGAKLPAAATLVWAMYHPAVWDLAVWLVPNPRGAFADLNPDVK